MESRTSSGNLVSPTVRNRSRSRGFTLIELLCVVTVLALVLGLTFAGMGGSLASQRLHASATALAGHLSSAALQAVRENRDIELRLLRGKAEFGTDEPIAAIQFYSVDPTTGVATASSAILPFEGDVVIYEDVTCSTLLGYKAPQGGQSTCTFKPTGTTMLPKNTGEQWCLTLVNARDRLSATGGLPANHRVVVINPHNGAIKTY